MNNPLAPACRPSFGIMTAPSQFAYDEAVQVWREAPSRANTSNNDPAASEEASDEPAGVSALTSPATTVNVT